MNHQSSAPGLLFLNIHGAHVVSRAHFWENLQRPLLHSSAVPCAVGGLVASGDFEFSDSGPSIHLMLPPQCMQGLDLRESYGLLEPSDVIDCSHRLIRTRAILNGLGRMSNQPDAILCR
jgi:hypothetical protein